MATETPAKPPYRQFRPDPRLRPYLLCFWAIHAPCPACGPRRIRVLPDGCLDVIFNFGDAMTPLGVPASQPGTFIVGASMRPGVVEMHGRADITGIRLRPGGAVPLLGLPCAELTENTGPTELLGPGLAERLRLHAGSEPDPARRVEIMERLLLELLSRLPAIDPLSRRALELLGSNCSPPMPVAADADANKHTVATLAATLGVSRRSLERLFARQVGVGPAALHRTMRLHRALRLLRRNTAPLAETALIAGYCDQAHFNREIKTLTGLAPLALLHEWRDDAIVQYEAPDFW
ncbi:MAG: DUF6597 domain-containing transcriptional factor [Desulfovibrio sp.]